MTALGLLVQAAYAFLDGESAKGLSRPQLVALTSTPRRGAARAEERPQVVAARLVGGHDRDRTVPRGHAHNDRGQRVQWSWAARARPCVRSPRALPRAYPWTLWSACTHGWSRP